MVAWERYELSPSVSIFWLAKLWDLNPFGISPGGLDLRLNFTEDIGQAKAVRDYGLNLHEAESIFVSDKTLREQRAFSRPSFSSHTSSLADS